MAELTHDLDAHSAHDGSDEGGERRVPQQDGPATEREPRSLAPAIRPRRTLPVRAPEKHEPERNRLGHMIKTMRAASPTPRAIPALVPEDDTALVDKVRAGDERAFAVLYRRYAQYIAGLSYRLMGDALELDDIVQDTFVAASVGIGNLQDPSLVRPWLVTIAARQAQRRLKARQRRRWLGQETLRQSPRVSDPRVAREVEELYDVVDRLSVKLRVPWLLARLEGLPLEEVAASCELSLATVKRRLTEADELIERRLGNG